MHLPLPSNRWGVCSSSSSIYHRLFFCPFVIFAYRKSDHRAKKGEWKRSDRSFPPLSRLSHSELRHEFTHKLGATKFGRRFRLKCCMYAKRESGVHFNLCIHLSPSLPPFLACPHTVGARPFLVHGPRLSWVTFVGKFVPKQGRGKGGGRRGQSVEIAALYGILLNYWFGNKEGNNNTRSLRTKTRLFLRVFQHV